MNAGATAERVYEALRARIMAHEFRPGDRLDPAHIAGSLAASVTPVRDALNRLTGERLVESASAGGFHLPSLDEPGLKDLYDWSASLLGLALRHRRRGFAALSSSNGRPIAIWASDIFQAIGQGSSNIEHFRAIGQLNARLHSVRIVEALLFEDGEVELAALDKAWTDGSGAELMRLISAYHRRRRRAAADIVRAVYRD